MLSRTVLLLSLVLASGCGQPSQSSCFDSIPCGISNECSLSGRTVCQGGQATCVGAQLEPDGVPCTGGVCMGGACTPQSCSPGGRCTLSAPGERCLVGRQQCDAGSVTCVATGELAPDGQPCGPDSICQSGVCGPACMSGAACTTTQVCHVGITSCQANGQVCNDSGAAPNGTACGTDGVCQSGQCVECQAGLACTSPDPCRTGITACTQGQSQCMADQPLADGTSCGTDYVCQSGQCQLCKAGVACTSGCQVGQTSCATGVSQCIPTGNLSDGTACGADEVCHAGVCGACQGGADCATPLACVRGVISCSSGEPVCNAVGNRAPGTSCNSGAGVCDGSGACVACAAGAACGTTCSPATIVCSSGAPVCTPQPQAPNWTVCGTNQYCVSGVCMQEHTLTVISGDAQSGIVGQLMQPVVLHLADINGDPVVGAFVSSGQGVATDAQGNATFTKLFFPDDVGSYTWSFTEQAQVSGLDATTTLSVSAVAPTAGLMMTLINVSHQPGVLKSPSSLRATLAPLTQPSAMVAIGTSLYVADGCQILVYKPWSVSVYAGGDCAPSSGDGSYPPLARFAAIRALGYDATNHLLLIAEPDRIRAVNPTLNSGTVSTVAGGPNPPIPGDGDGGLATAAVLTDVQDVAVGPDGSWYVGANGRIRRIDASKRTIQPWYTPATPTDCSGASTVVSCDQGCRVAWDAQKRPWMTANLCGGGVNPSGRGLVLLDQGAFTVKVDQISNGSRIAYDGANGILLADPASQEVRRVDTLTSAVTVIAGTGIAGDGAELAPANLTALHDPAAATVLGGHVVISDSSNHCVRRIW